MLSIFFSKIQNSTDLKSFLNKLVGCTIDIINRLNTISNLFNLKLMFRRHLTPSSEKFLLHEPARFHGNDTSWRSVDSFSVRRKASGDAETSTLY